MQGKFSDISTELESWYGTDTGQYLLAQTRASLSSILDTSFGYHLLQIGPAREQRLFDDSPINHRIYASSRDGGAVGLISEPESLPLESDSVDTLIAHHCLEFAEEPHQALREMQRVLTPQGKLIIIGLNPYSLLGGAAWIRRKMGSRLWSSHQPVSQHRVGADFARSIHQVGAVPLPLLAAARHGGADAGERLPALGHDGETRRLPLGAHLSGLRRHRAVAMDGRGRGPGNHGARCVLGHLPGRPQGAAGVLDDQPSRSDYADVRHRHDHDLPCAGNFLSK